MRRTRRPSVVQRENENHSEALSRTACCMSSSRCFVPGTCESILVRTYCPQKSEKIEFYHKVIDLSTPFCVSGFEASELFHLSRFKTFHKRWRTMILKKNTAAKVYPGIQQMVRVVVCIGSDPLDTTCKERSTLQESS